MNVRILANLIAGVLTAVFVAACSSPSRTIPSEFGRPNPAAGLEAEAQTTEQPALTEVAPVKLGQVQILEAQQSRRSKVPVLFQARVYKLLRDDTEGLPHQKFLLMLENGTTVLVAHNTRMAPRVPINPGDMVTIKGEYVWNQKGGLVHWTHHSDSPRHDGGFIEFGGQRYQ